MKQTTILTKVLLAAAISSGSVAMAQSSSAAAPQSSMPVTEATQKAKSPFGFSYLGLFQRNGKLADSHFADASGNDQYSDYASALDVENHFKLSYKLASGDKLVLNQRVFASVVTNQDNARYGGQVPYLGMTRLEYKHKIGIGQGSELVGRVGLPLTYDLMYNQNQLASLAGIANLNWDVNPKISLGVSSFTGVGLAAGNRRSLSPWQEDAIARGFSNDWSEEGNAAYLSKTAAERDYVLFDNQASVTLNATDKLALVQSFGYGFGLSNISNNFAKFKKYTAFFEASTEVDYQATPAVGLAAGASQTAADMAGATDTNGKGIFYNNRNFSLFKAEETTYYMQVTYVY